MSESIKKVVKFGGSSLASAEQFRKSAAIVLAEESRRYVVPSAPGKRFPEDETIFFKWDLMFVGAGALVGMKTSLRISQRFVATLSKVARSLLWLYSDNLFFSHIHAA